MTVQKAANRAYSCDYNRAFRAEIASSGDKRKACQAGKVAGQAERKRLATASVSGEFRAPGLSRQDEGLIIDPFELVSSCVNGQPSKGKKIKQ